MTIAGFSTLNKYLYRRPVVNYRPTAENIPGRIRILDNSVGSGRLLQYADPERHAVFAFQQRPSGGMFANFDSALNLPFNSANVFEFRYEFFYLEILNKYHEMMRKHPNARLCVKVRSCDASNEPFQTTLGGRWSAALAE